MMKEKVKRAAYSLDYKLEAVRLVIIRPDATSMQVGNSQSEWRLTASVRSKAPEARPRQRRTPPRDQFATALLSDSQNLLVAFPRSGVRRSF